MVVAVPGQHVGLDQGEVGEGARGGIPLELGERHEVGGQPVLQPREWMTPVKERRIGSMT